MVEQIIKAFIVGGIFCAIGQILIDRTKMTPGRILVTYVVAGVFLSAFGFYEKLIDFGGAGATVPLTGFGHILAKGVRETVDERGFIGIFSGGLTATASGVTIALLSGFLVALLFKSKAK
ncbi:stage V sporulation protein AE [Clostridia bacterium]|nr:stage V sporulation protein AE [Clostridia bacterium]